MCCYCLSVWPAFKRVRVLVCLRGSFVFVKFNKLQRIAIAKMANYNKMRTYTWKFVRTEIWAVCARSFDFLCGLCGLLSVCIGLCMCVCVWLSECCVCVRVYVCGCICVNVLRCLRTQTEWLDWGGCLNGWQVLCSFFLCEMNAYSMSNEIRDTFAPSLSISLSPIFRSTLRAFSI